MPELPDVESFRRYFDKTARHKPIKDVVIDSPNLIQGLWPDELRNRLIGRRFEQTRRYGKYLFARLDRPETLVIHFGMTGSFVYQEKADIAEGENHQRAKPSSVPPYTRILFKFSDGSALGLRDPRKFSRLSLEEDEDQFIREKSLGIDALDPELTLEHFVELLDEKGTSVKCWLMDQSNIAGVGNDYSDEILFQARIHPKRAVSDLKPEERRALYRKLHSVLETAVKLHADPSAMPASYLLPHRKAGENCPHCGGRVETLAACGRTAYYCPACQPA